MGYYYTYYLKVDQTVCFRFNFIFENIMALITVNLPHLRADAYTNKLDQMIKDYNDVPSLDKLQYLDAYANYVLEVYKKNPWQAHPNFMRWFMQGNISHELNGLPHTNPNVSKEKNFMANYNKDTSDDLLTLEAWQQFTRRKISRLPEHSAVDTLLIKVALTRELTRQSRFEDTTKNRVYYEALKGLQAKVLETITTTPASKKNRLAKLDRLLQQTNRQLDNITRFNVGITFDVPPIPIIERIILAGEESIDEFTAHLFTSQENIYVNGAELRYRGGNNNKIWVATIASEDEAKVVRLEKAEFTDYLLLMQVTGHQRITRHLGEQYYFFACNESYPCPGYSTYFNIVVSEYFPHGDLLTFRRQLSKNQVENETILNHVLNLTQQVGILLHDFVECSFPYLDVKAENFLIRERLDEVTGIIAWDVVTTDLKSLRRANAEGRVEIKNLETSILPPEMVNPPENVRTVGTAEFGVYQLGVLLYELMVGEKEPKPWKAYFYKHDAFNFNYPLFNSPRGQAIRQLIQQATQVDPSLRPSLLEISAACQELIENLDMEHPNPAFNP